MVRVFGLLIAALALMARANAALLTYDFNNNVNGVVDPTATGATSSPLSRTPGDNLLATAYQTTAVSSSATTTQNSFTFTAGGLPATLTDVEIFGRRIGTGGFSVSVSYKIGSGPVTVIDTATPTGSDSLLKFSFLNGNGDPTSIVLAAGSTATFYIDTTWASGTGPRYQLDYMNLNGSAVPEPASMAIFGLMGAGLAVRRFRRK